MKLNLKKQINDYEELKSEGVIQYVDTRFIDNNIGKKYILTNVSSIYVTISDSIIQHIIHGDLTMVIFTDVSNNVNNVQLVDSNDNLLMYSNKMFKHLAVVCER